MHLHIILGILGTFCEALRMCLCACVTIIARKAALQACLKQFNTFTWSEACDKAFAGVQEAANPM